MKKHTEFIKSITKKSLLPSYLLHGVETYFTTQILAKILDIAIPKHEKDFNEYILHGKDIDVGTLIGYVRKYPMMAEKQLIVVKDAEQIQDINQKEKVALLEDYLLSPQPSTILVLHANSAFDERRTWVKSFGKNGHIFQAKPLYDSELPDFVMDFCHSKGVKISMKAVQLIVEHIGNDLSRIANEIDKIILNLKINEGIDAPLVERFIGISKEYNVFELQKALIQRSLPDAIKIINYMGSNIKNNPIQPIVIILYNFFSKLLVMKQAGGVSDAQLSALLGVKPFFLKDYHSAARNYGLMDIVNAIGLLRIADMESKGVDASRKSELQILQSLVVGILVK